MLLPLLLLPSLLLAQQSGLAIVGGKHLQTRNSSWPLLTTSAEFWAPAPGELHCSLPSLTWRMDRGPTLVSWQDTLIACSDYSCDQLTPSGWQHWRNTSYSRSAHTSAVTSQGLLLVGGQYSITSTELLPWEGGESREGFTLQEARADHCSIQLSPGTIILTGGHYYPALVTEYSGLDAGEEVTSRELPPLLRPRSNHACGWYSVGDSQVLMVTGGVAGRHYLDTTEVFPYTGPGEGSWREAGLLPSPRYALRAAKVSDLLHVTGGYNPVSGNMDEILTWDSVSESWSVAGHMQTARRDHGVTEVSLAVVADHCSVN